MSRANLARCGVLIVKNLLLLVTSAALCLGAAELWFRSQTPLELGFRYEQGIFRRPVEFRIDEKNDNNKWGMHDLEPTRKAKGTVRVVLLGDSYVASRSVRLEQAVGRRLEHHLNLAGDGQYDVVSLGQRGWGQRQQLIELEKRGPFLQPDIVVTLFLSLNDVRNNHPELQAQGLTQFSEMARFRPGRSHFPKENAPLFWFEGSALNRTVSYRLAVLLQRHNAPQIPIDYFVFAEDYDSNWDDAWRLTEGLLRQTSERELGARYFLVSASTPQGVKGAEDGLRLLTSAYPAMRSRSWDLDKPDKKLARIAEMQNSPFLALEPAFRQLTRETGVQLHWEYNGHWNAEGNDAAGRAIAEFIHAQTFSSHYMHSNLSHDGMACNASPDQSFRMVYDIAGLDFAGLSDHAGHFRESDWWTVTKHADLWNQPGRFVAIPGYEWSSRVYGHKNVFFQDTVQADPGALLDALGLTPEALWQHLGERRAVTIPHHVSTGPAGAKPTDWRFRNDHFQRLVEIFQGRGSYEFDGAPYPPPAGSFTPGHSVRAALDQGQRLGIIASPDHRGGLGLAGVWVSALTREAIFEALHARRTFGTTGARLDLWMTVNGAPQGSEITVGGAVHVKATVHGTAPGLELTLVSNGEELARQDFEGTAAHFERTDTRPPVSTRYSYLRARQADGHLGWSSPVWVSGERSDSNHEASSMVERRGAGRESAGGGE